MAAVVVTARSVTISLNGAPKSSEAYEAGERILAMIKSSIHQKSGDVKMVTITIIHTNNPWCMHRRVMVLVVSACHLTM